MDCIQKRRNNAKRGEAKLYETLPTTKLRFSTQQLCALNYRLRRKIHRDESDIEPDKSAKQTESIVERLIQRLISAVGNFDPRFASKFLVILHNNFKKQNHRDTKLKYLIRLDALSTPLLYPSDLKPSCEILEYNPDSSCSGCAKIRLRNKTAMDWAEFVNASGYLRRDKIQERFVELLALAAGSSWPTTPLDVDESFLCAAPGKVVDAATLHHILHCQPDECIFYGAAASNVRFPDPRDFRLAIVDEPSGVRVRIGFLSPAFAGRDVDVRLLLAVGVDAWPQSCGFPARVQLGHAECLLYQQAAETGMYLIGCGKNNVVQSSSVCWEIQVPAAEEILLNHYGPESTVSVVLEVLYAILDEMHSQIDQKKSKFTSKLLSRRSMRETLWRVLESEAGNPLTVMLNWTSQNLSKQVLNILDQIINSLRQRILPGYMFPNTNRLASASEDECLVEANRVHMYLGKLYDDGLRALDEHLEESEALRKCDEMDAMLVRHWYEVVEGLMPAAATRSSRFSCATAAKTRHGTPQAQYNARQLEYIGLLLKSTLKVKQNSILFTTELPEIDCFPLPEDPIEDVIYLLVTIIEQARDNSNEATLKPKYNTRTQSRFDLATAKLVEAVRKDHNKFTEFLDDISLVKTVLRWLYKGMDQSKQNLGPVLRPYLQKLFITSHQMSWHLQTLKRRDALDEIYALGVYCRLVNAKKLSPAEGLIESVNKGWNWAKETLQLVERSVLRVIFCPDRGKVYRHILSLPGYDKSSALSRSVTNTFRQDRVVLKDTSSRTNATLPARSFRTLFKSEMSRSTGTVSHKELQGTSPMTWTFQFWHHQGHHRCSGDLIQSMISLNKISILQEISKLLPTIERQHLLDAIQKLCKESKRQMVIRRKGTLPTTSNKTIQLKSPRLGNTANQKYTPTLHNFGSSRFGDKETRNEKSEKVKLQDDSLLGSCRAARLCEDSQIIVHKNLQI